MHKSIAIVHIEPGAAQKPLVGAPCNGCGVCCLMEPCPLGVVLTGRRTGACSVLHWQPQHRLYRCGAIVSASDVLRICLPAAFHAFVPLLAWLLERLARRWVAAGMGCDCEVQVATPVSEAESLRCDQRTMRRCK